MKNCLAVALVVSCSLFHSPAEAGRRGMSTDIHFARKAAVAGTAEVALGQLALQRGGPAVQQFANQMVQDHTMQNQQLMQVAASAGISAQPAIDRKHAAIMNQLSTLSGPSFDAAYAAAMVQDHVQTIALFQNHGLRASNPQLRAFAQQSLPILQQHLHHAQMLRDGLMQGGYALDSYNSACMPVPPACY